MIQVVTTNLTPPKIETVTFDPFILGTAFLHGVEYLGHFWEKEQTKPGSSNYFIAVDNRVRAMTTILERADYNKAESTLIARVYSTDNEYVSLLDLWKTYAEFWSNFTYFNDIIYGKYRLTSPEYLEACCVLVELLMRRKVGRGAIITIPTDFTAATYGNPPTRDQVRESMINSKPLFS